MRETIVVSNGCAPVGPALRQRRLTEMLPSWRDTASGSAGYRAMCLLAACGIYALSGSPTPDRLGLPEILTGLLLAMAVGAGAAGQAVTPFAAGREIWQGAGQIFLIYGLSVPVVTAAVNGHNFGDVARDVIPFLFLFLPLFFTDAIARNPGACRFVLWGVLAIGLVFALRSVLMRDPATCGIWCTDELLYLENMPTVLFSALFLTGTACARVMRRSGPADLLWFALALALALLPLAAMALTLQRASLGAFALYGILVYAYLFYKRPYRALVLGVCAVAAVAAVGVTFSATIESLGHKTALVGLNNRPQELRAVWDVVSQSPATFLFGTGWGGHVHSPAVGGLSVNFTHNFFTSVLLKTGACGLFLALGYILGILALLSRLVLRHPVLGLALCAPVLIDLTLYASFKSLDFGLVLLLIPAALIYWRPPESGKSC